MIRSTVIFLLTFAAGALLALVARAALFDPHAGQAPASPSSEYAPMVSNPLAPADDATAPAHEHPAAESPPASEPEAAAAADENPAPVNTVCAICGMDVDPSLPTETYQGKTIGFGCRMCPPRFRADPDRYGPYYLRNEVMPK